MKMYGIMHKNKLLRYKQDIGTYFTAGYQPQVSSTYKFTTDEQFDIWMTSDIQIAVDALNSESLEHSTPFNPYHQFNRNVIHLAEININYKPIPIKI